MCECAVYWSVNLLVPLQECLNQTKSLKCEGNRKGLTSGRKVFSYLLFVYDTV